MIKNHRWRFLRVFVICFLLTSMTACNRVTTQTSTVDLSAVSSDISSFIDQFAREALAALLL